VRYAEKKGIQYSVLSNFAITLAQLQEMIEEEGLTIRQGDILLVRCGMGKWHKASTPDMQGPSLQHGGHIGVEYSPELVEWLWDSHFAAVGGDGIAFESVPAADGSRK